MASVNPAHRIVRINSVETTVAEVVAGVAVQMQPAQTIPVYAILDMVIVMGRGVMDVR